MERMISLRAFITSGLSSLVGVTLIVIGVMIWQLVGYERMQSYIQNRQSVASACRNLLGQGLQMGQATRNIILDPSNPTAFKNFDKAANDFKDLIKHITTLNETREGSLDDSLKKIQAEFERDMAEHQSIHDLARARESSRAVELLNSKETPLWRKYKDMILELTKNAEDQSAAAKAKGEVIASRMHHVLEGIVAFVIAVCVLVFGGTMRLVSRIQMHLRAISQSTEASALTARSLSEVSISLAEGASEQAAALEESSSSLEQMSAMTKQNAEHVRHADELMQNIRRVVEKAESAVKELTGSMGEITRASEETQKIIKTIDEIAFQTNLLALNAAVEAARAGESGAGFAVVADEVRNLAMRAADAAKNTADMIEGTVKKVKDGAQLAGKTNEVFAEVSQSTGTIGGLIAEIAAASSEQAEGINQINIAVTEVDKVVQQNAANAEESASASEEMSAQAAKIRNSVGELVALIGAMNARKRAEENNKTAFLDSNKRMLPSP